MKSSHVVILAATLLVFAGCNKTPQTESPSKDAGASAAGGSAGAAAGQKSEMKTTASGLKYQVIKQGTGTASPKATDTVKVHYHGTLLDGTKVNLPAKPQAATKKRLPSDPPVKEAAAGSEGLTARDLVAALRALSHGADATEILGENVRWEALFSALLSLMLKKHIIADWEFVEEYKKI